MNLCRDGNQTLAASASKAIRSRWWAVGCQKSEQRCEQARSSFRAAQVARFHSFSVVGDDPVLTLMGVVPASRKVLARAGMSVDEIDVFEVNEAFAPVPLAWAREMNADPARVNPRGGAIALGHPLGASGLRLMSTMVNYLSSTGGRYGLQTMCEGGGMANATIIERL